MPRACGQSRRCGAMIWGEYGLAPRFPRPTGPPPIGELIQRFERLRAAE